MKVFLSFVRKELIHIVRDSRTMVLAVMMPLVLLLLFGFAISTEVTQIKVAVSNGRHTDVTRALCERLRVNPSVDFRGECRPGDVERLMRQGEIDVAVITRTSPTGARPEIQLIIDASNPTSAQAYAAYVGGIISADSSREPTKEPPVVSRTLFNPEMRSAFNFVPGIMGMIFILICAILTSVSIVREKETGTMDLLLVSPIGPSTIILGKLVPYLLLSCVILGAMLAVAYGVLGLPSGSSVTIVVTLSLLYIVLSLSIGLLVSAIADTQLAALIVSAVVFMLPVIMLSGMIFPIDNMPTALQWVSAAIPARWYTEAMRKLMVEQLGWSGITREVTILAAMTVAILAVAIRKFSFSK